MTNSIGRSENGYFKEEKGRRGSNRTCYFCFLLMPDAIVWRWGESQELWGDSDEADSAECLLTAGSGDQTLPGGARVILEKGVPAITG